MEETAARLIQQSGKAREGNNWCRNNWYRFCFNENRTDTNYPPPKTQINCPICLDRFHNSQCTPRSPQGVKLEDVQYLAGHTEPRTTGLYDRRQKQLTRGIVERISA